MIQTRRKLAALTLAVIILANCGGSTILRSFRVALASSGPLVNSLVASGAIPQTKATAIINDFDAAAQCGLTLESAFTSIPKELPERERTARKLNASVAGLRCFRTISAAGNFTSHPRVRQIADIAEGILASLVVFYSEPGEMRASAERTATATARNEKDLEAQLKKQVDEMKRLLEAG